MASSPVKGKSGLLEYIRRVGCIQFDPLNIVGQNPELVFQARVECFQTTMLQELLYADRALLDGWDKNMSIYLVQDWPYFQRNRDTARGNFGGSDYPLAAVVPQVRQAIEQRGPVSSIDLDFNQTVDWSWAPTRMARAALESMYAWGELVVHHKVNTRKVYDFAKRHLPNSLLSASDPNKTEEQYHDWYIQRRIGGIGLIWAKAGDAWLGMSGIKSRQRNSALSRLMEKGVILPVEVDGLGGPLYIRGKDKATLDKTVEDNDNQPQAVILALLDNLLWDRRYLEALFGFYYIWEVYKPVAERRYGYYVLPILYGDRFIARFEPGRDKRSSAMKIENWWWEDGVTQSEKIRFALRDCFQRFLSYLGKDGLQIDPGIVQKNNLRWLVDYF